MPTPNDFFCALLAIERLWVKIQDLWTSSVKIIFKKNKKAIIFILKLPLSLMGFGLTIELLICLPNALFTEQSYIQLIPTPDLLRNNAEKAQEKLVDLQGIKS